MISRISGAAYLTETHGSLSPGLDNSTELDRILDSYSTGYSTG
jgi:hypothetical protein